MDDIKTKSEVALFPSTEIPMEKENHEIIASHLQTAAKSYLQAVKLYWSGNHQEAAQSTIIAYGHVCRAKRAQEQEQDIEQHVVSG